MISMLVVNLRLVVQVTVSERTYVSVMFRLNLFQWKIDIRLQLIFRHLINKIKVVEKYRCIA